MLTHTHKHTNKQTRTHTHRQNDYRTLPPTLRGEGNNIIITGILTIDIYAITNVFVSILWYIRPINMKQEIAQLSFP